MTKRKRLPQEDKVLSYVKDRRNTYGENDKGSRTPSDFASDASTAPTAARFTTHSVLRGEIPTKSPTG